MAWSRSGFSDAGCQIFCCRSVYCVIHVHGCANLKDRNSVRESRYYTEAMCSHWSKNKRGLCLLSPVECIDTIEDLNHIIKICPVLTPCRQNLVLFTEKYADKIESTEICALLTNLCDLTHPSFVNFLLDCSSLSEVIASVQQHGQAVLHHLFRVKRTWLFVLHRERLKILGRWNNFC